MGKYITIIKRLSNTKLFSILIIYLIVLLIIGTISQKYYGLHYAYNTFFASYIIWVTGYIPVPGGNSIIALILLGLIGRVFYYQWKIKFLGTIITHIGVTILLAGSIVTYYLSFSGNMLIAEKQTTKYVSDYDDIELVISKNNQKEIIFPEGYLQDHHKLANNNIDFDLDVITFHKNCVMIKRQDSSPDTRSLAQQFDLRSIKLAIISEENQACIKLKVSNLLDIQNNGYYIVHEAMPIQQKIYQGKDTYSIFIRKKTYVLPFEVTLNKVTKINYVNSQKARNYKSEITISDSNVNWKSIITMNNPTIYKGYTIYQSEYIEDENEKFSVFTVNKNQGKAFPYLSIIVICIGLLLHIVISGISYSKLKW